MLKRGTIIYIDPTKFKIEHPGGSVQDFDRPWVIISNDINNTGRSTIIQVAAISKQERKTKFPMHVHISKNKYNLRYDSTIYAEQIQTIPKEAIKSIGNSLDRNDMLKLNKAILIQLIDPYCNIKYA